MKLIKYILIVFIISSSNLLALDESEFSNWKKRFKKIALENKISETTFDIVMSDVKFLPKVIALDSNSLIFLFNSLQAFLLTPE